MWSGLRLPFLYEFLNLEPLPKENQAKLIGLAIKGDPKYKKVLDWFLKFYS